MICSILLEEARCNVLASLRPIILKLGRKMVRNYGTVAHFADVYLLLLSDCQAFIPFLLCSINAAGK